MERTADEMNIPDESPAKLILSVDYTDAALTALLIFEECNVFEYRRVLHSTELGAAAGAVVRNNGTAHIGLEKLTLMDEEVKKVEQSRREEALARAFRKISTLPLDDGGNGDQLHWISHIILLGERGCDPIMLGVLKDVLVEQYARFLGIEEIERYVEFEIKSACTGEKDVMFAAGRATARDCWDRWSYKVGER